MTRTRPPEEILDVQTEEAGGRQTKRHGRTRRKTGRIQRTRCRRERKKKRKRKEKEKGRKYARTERR